MLTTGFPRFSGDLFGNFILHLTRELVVQGSEVAVVAPHESGLVRRELMAGAQVSRFRYLLPEKWQQLAYGGGIPSNIRASWISSLQIPPFLFGFWWAAVGSCKRCDIVHCHWTISGLVAYLATRFSPRPLVLSVRGSDLHLMAGKLLGWLNRRIYQRMDVVIAVSHDIAEKLEASGLERDKIRVVHNGVGPEFRPGDRLAMRQRLDLPESRFIVLFVGLLVPVKGVDVLLEAVHILSQERLYCILVGDGPWRQDLEHRSRSLGVEEQIRFAGRRPSSEIPAWLCAADVLALPSLSEGRPNVVLEAQACGIPVVATRVGGTPELVRHEDTGILVEAGSPTSLAAALERLSNDDALRLALGRAGRASIEEGDSTWGATAAKVAEIYRELAEDR